MRIVTACDRRRGMHQQEEFAMRAASFFRHGHALKTAGSEHDFDRSTSDHGLDQVASRRGKLNGKRFDLTLSSPAKRALECAAIIGSVDMWNVIRIESLYPLPDDGSLGQHIDRLFKRLGYVPVSTYLKEPDGAYLIDWAKIAWFECKREIDDYGYANSVAIVGHAPCLTALAMEACRGNDQLVAQIA